MRSARPARADPLAGVACLLGAEGGGGHPAAVVPGGVHGEAAPAGADLQHVVRRARGRACGRCGRAWRSGRSARSCVRRARRRRTSRSASGRGRRRRSRCPGRSGRRCCAGRRGGCCAAARARSGARAPAGPGSGAVQRRSTALVAGQDAHQRDQVVAGPPAVHVGPARAGALAPAGPRDRRPGRGRSARRVAVAGLRSPPRVQAPSASRRTSSPSRRSPRHAQQQAAAGALPAGRDAVGAFGRAHRRPLPFAGVRHVRHALAPEPQGLPVDAADDLQAVSHG